MQKAVEKPKEYMQTLEISELTLIYLVTIPNCTTWCLQDLPDKL